MGKEDSCSSSRIAPHVVGFRAYGINGQKNSPYIPPLDPLLTTSTLRISLIGHAVLRIFCYSQSWGRFWEGSQ